MAGVGVIVRHFLEQLLRNEDRLASIISYLLDYLHDSLAGVVDGQTPKK